MGSTARARLLQTAEALCTDFAQKKDVDIILSHFSTTHECTAVEHGEPSLAPFLGRPFVGLSAIKQYFSIIAQLLTYQDMRFSQFVVDTEARRVSTKGQARFTWTSTGESWDETFVYMLGFDHDYKITEYEVWADSGAAYLAKVGRLSELQRIWAIASRGYYI